MAKTCKSHHELFDDLNNDSKCALAKSKSELKAKIDKTQTSTLAIIYKQEGYNVALRDFIKRYKATDRDTELRQLADAVDLVDLVDAKAELDKRNKAKGETAQLMEEAKKAAEKTGEMIGTIDTIYQMVSHALAEPPKLLDDGTRNPAHVATLGFRIGQDIVSHTDLIHLVKPPKEMRGADYGFCKAMAKGITAMRTARTQVSDLGK